MNPLTPTVSPVSGERELRFTPSLRHAFTPSLVHVNMAELLESIEIETAPKPDVSIIWMHGLGADGNDFVPIV